jgi:putative transposase
VPDKRQRRTIRLPGYDYTSRGAYFVTICANKRQLFEDAVLADVLEREWQDLPKRFSSVELDAFVVMPNHVHFIVWLGGSPHEGVAAPFAGASTPQLQGSPQQSIKAGASPAPTLGDVVGAYKSLTAVRWLRWTRENRPSESARIWQRNYYERIVRDEAELNRIREYIAYNPTAWQFDHENPARAGDNRHEELWAWLEFHG